MVIRVWKSPKLTNHTFKLIIYISYMYAFNSSAPVGCESNSKSVIFEHMLGINFLSTSCVIALMWMP